jgi:carboxypeptidase Taq
MVTATAYLELERRFARVSLVRDSSAMLSWDWATMMPEGAAGARAKQLAELEMISHERLRWHGALLVKAGISGR